MNLLLKRILIGDPSEDARPLMKHANLTFINCLFPIELNLITNLLLYTKGK